MELGHGLRLAQSRLREGLGLARRRAGVDQRLGGPPEDEAGPHARREEHGEPGADLELRLSVCPADPPAPERGERQDEAEEDAGADTPEDGEVEAREERGGGRLQDLGPSAGREDEAEGEEADRGVGKVPRGPHRSRAVRLLRRKTSSSPPASPYQVIA